MKTKSSKIGFYISALLFLAMALGLAMPLQTARAASVVLVDNLQSSWTAPGGGGVFSAYIGPPDYGYVSPGTTAIYDGFEAGIIKAGFVGAVPAEGSKWDEGLFGFKPNVTINDFAAGALTYDVENQYGENPVWITIDIDTGVVDNRADDTSYQFVPTTNPAGWHTVNAAAGLWQKWNNYEGDVTGNPLISLSDVAAAHTGLNVVRAYLRLGMGASYHGTAGLGTVAWVDQATIAGVTYDFVVPTYWYVAKTGLDTNEGTAASPFLTIQHAIGAASPSDAINVAAGTYTEQVNITKSLTLSGAGMTNTHIESPTPTSMTIYDAFGSQSPTNRYIVHRGTNIPVVRIAASNVVFEGFHVNLNNYVFWDVLGSYPADTTYSRGVGILVDHVETVLGTPDVFTGIAIQNNKVDGLLSGDKGDGIKVLGNATATVTGNYLYGGESGINVQAVDGPVRGQYYPTVTANSNTIYSSGPSGGPFGIGFWSRATGSADGNTIYNDPVNGGYALNVWGSRPVSFTNNTVTNVGGVVGGLGAQLIESTNLIFTNNRIEYQALAGAIWSNPTATITGNTIINCTDGFVVDQQTSGAVTMHSNSFTGITASHYAVEVGGPAGGASGTFWGTWTGPSTVTVDASGNWWGNADPTTVAGNISGTVDFTPLLDSGTDTDLGAPGFQPSLSSLTVHTLGSQTGSTGRIQEGINLVSGSTVNVAAGTYVEVGQIVISKNLTIVGENKATTIIQPNQNTGSSSDSRGWFLVPSGFTFNLSNVTLDGNGHKIYQGIRDLGSGTINNVIFTDIQYEASGPAYMGNAVAAMGGTGANVNITNSSFDNIGRIGVIFYGTGQTGTFDNNVYTGKVPGNWLDYGVEVGGGAHATITNNTISGNRGVASSDGSTSAGILVTTYYGSGSQAIITGNTLTDNTTGIAVGFNASDTSVVTAHNNAIYNNSEAGIDTTSSTIVVDATSNWWGAASGPYDNKGLPGTPNYNNPSGTGNNVSPYVD